MRANTSLDIHVLQYISSYFPNDVILRFLWDPFHMTENTVYRIYMVHYLLEFFYYYREALAFATEPVFASLANVLGDHTNVPTPVPSELTEYKLFDVEIKHGIIQVNAHNKNLISVQKIYCSGVLLNDNFFLSYIIMYNLREISEIICCR